MRLITLFIAALICTAQAYDGDCGTMKVIENLINYQKQPHFASTLYRDGQCRSEQYYDSVYTIETPHFQIVYVLTGPHATTEEFANKTASSMEEAWNLYVNKQKMREPKGPSKSYHFQQKVTNGLYPVEIVDIDQIRDNKIFFGESGECGSCFAVTVPLNNATASQIFMDNDFYYAASQNRKSEKFISNGDTCYYAKATTALYNTAHNYSYTKEWAKGIRLTSFHELYHAVQLRYLNMFSNQTFWFEASATGFEEVTNPEVDDYHSYLSSFFARMGEPISKTFKNYGASSFFLYLYHKVSNDLDHSIWENFSKNPEKNFETQFEASLNEKKLDPDSVFHDFSVRLSLSGNRTSYFPQKEWINDDQSQWPSARFSIQDTIKPYIESLAFDFYRNRNGYQEPDLSNFIGKATVIAFHDGEASFHKINSNKSLDSLTAVLSTCDSSMWVFSRFGKSESIPITNNTSAPHAFPVPWRNGALCFAPLPRDKKFFEIRNRRGDLIVQQKYEGTSFCLQEDQVKSMMAPGIYRFRVGNKGKTTSFIVIY